MTNISLSPHATFSRVVSSERLRRLIISTDRAKAIKMGLWDQFKDLFFSEKKEKFLGDMYDFIHQVANEPMNSKAIEAIRTVIRDAPQTKVVDFFSWEDDTGRPLLNTALKNGDADTVGAYARFLDLLSPPQLKNHLVKLLSANDANGNPGLAWALEHGHTEAIIQYGKLLNLLSETEQKKHLFALLAAKDQNGNPGLWLALEKGHTAAIQAYESLLPADHFPADLMKILLAINEEGHPGVAQALRHGHADAINTYRLMLERIPEHARTPQLNAILLAMATVKPQSLLGAIQSNDGAQVIAYKNILAIVPESQRGTLLNKLVTRKFELPFDLARAFINGNDEIVLAYRELLKSLPEPEREKHIRDHLVDHSSGLLSALKFGDADIIPGYQRLLEMLDPGQRLTILTETLSARGRKNGPPLVMALMDGDDKFITAYTAIVKLLPQDWREVYLPALLNEKDPSGSPGLAWALERGHAKAILAYKELLQLLPEEQRLEYLPAVDYRGDSGLILAMRYGHSAAVDAYGELMKLIPHSQRSAWFPDLLFAKNRSDDDSGLVKALSANSPEVIIAFNRLVELLPFDCAHLAVEKIFLSGQYDLNILVNHLENSSQHSILSCINMMDDRCEALKKHLMLQIVKRLKTAELSPSQTRSIMDIWGRNPHTLNHPLIWERVTAMGNTGQLFADETQAANLICIVEKIVKSEGKPQSGQKTGSFMLENNGFFVQLIAACANHTDPMIKESACELYDQYLRLPELEQHAALLRDVVTCYGIRGSKTPAGKELVALTDEDKAYLFINLNENGSYDGVMISKNEIAAMLGQHTATDWASAGYVADMADFDEPPSIQFKPLGDVNTGKVFSQMPLFKTSYRIQHGLSKLSNFFGLLNLKYDNSSNEPGLLTQDYKDIFKAALDSRTSSKKLISPGHENTLNRIFNRFLTVPDKPGTSDWSLKSLPTISDTHIEKVLQAFGSTLDDDNKIHNARLLFCLSAIMVRLSSLSYFGTDGDSPRALRVYAAGLLNKAKQLYPELCSKADFEDFIKRLLRIGGGYSCTNVLSDRMVEFIQKQADLNACFRAIKPTAWA